MKRLLKQVLNLEVERYKDITNQKSFPHIQYKHLEPTLYTHVLYITAQEDSLTTLDGKVWQQFPYDMSGLAVANLMGELNMPVFLDGGLTFSIMLKHYYN